MSFARVDKLLILTTDRRRRRSRVSNRQAIGKRGSFERLESRDLLAGDLDVSVRLETSDLAGNPVASANVGDVFLLNAYVQDVRDPFEPPGGLFSAYFDVDYDPILASVDLKETQSVRLEGFPTSGSFTLSFQGQTTSDIPITASAADVKTALEALSTINGDMIDVFQGSFDEWTVRFGGDWVNLDVPDLTADSSGLLGGISADVVISQETGVNPNNIFDVMASVTYGPNYPDRPRAGIDPSGTLDEMGAARLAVGGLGPAEQLLFQVQFTADEAGTLDFTSNKADVLENETTIAGTTSVVPFERIDFGAISIEILLFSAVDDQFDVFENSQGHEFDVLDNDTLGSAGGPLEIVTVGDPDNGGNADIVGNKIVYSPAANTTGAETFVYTVRDPSGATLQATVTVDIASNSSAQIGNLVWKDLNLDGTQDAGEPGQQDVRVELFEAGSDQSIGVTTTDIDGLYSFAGLPSGDYYLEFSDLPSGFQFSTQNAGGDDTLDSDVNTTTGRTAAIALGNGENNDTIDVGLTQTPTAATARFDLSVVLDATTTDGNGQVDVVPDNAVWIHEWHSHWIEVWVSTPGNGVAGVTSAMVELDYDTSLFTATSVQPGAAFTGGLTSSVDDATGRIDLQGTKTAVESVGADKLVLLARIQMNATSEDTGVPIDLGESAPISSLGQPWIALADDGTAAAQLDGASANVDLGDSPTTDLYPVPYDLDDDGRIGFGDLAIFSGVFLANVTDSSVAYKSDFDLDDRVGFGDLSLLSTNFLKGRSDSDNIVMPLNFPSGFESFVASASMLPSMAAALMAEDAFAGDISTLSASPPASPSVEARTIDVEQGTATDLLTADPSSAAQPSSDVNNEWFSRVGIETEPTSADSSGDLDTTVLDALYASLGG